jgi:predicted acyltransferase
VSLTLSGAARRDAGADRSSLVRHALRRSFLLYLCGVFIDLLVFPYRHLPFFAFRDHLQLTGVLQKIAVCYLVAFLIDLWWGWRGVVAGIVGLNLLYLGLLFLYPVPGCGPGVLTPECSFASFVNERLLKGYTWGDTYDPDGLGAVLPAITSVLFGVLAGLVFRSVPEPRPRIAKLVTAGLVLVLAGQALAIWVPLNKPLWTPSYAMFMAGFAALTLAAWYLLADVRGWRQVFSPFKVLGMNAVVAYLISRPADHVLRVHVFGRSLYTDVLRRLANPPTASLLFAMLVLMTVYSVVWVMYRQRWFLKL